MKPLGTRVSVTEDEGVALAITHIEDITEQKAMERKLREIEELHESLIDLTSNL